MAKRKAPRQVWIAEVIVSDRTAAKLRGKHRLDPAEVVALVTSPPPRVGRYVTKRGGVDDGAVRVHIQVQTASKQNVLVVLCPFGDDAWGLASAYVLQRPRRA